MTQPIYRPFDPFDEVNITPSDENFLLTMQDPSGFDLPPDRNGIMGLQGQGGASHEFFLPNRTDFIWHPLQMPRTEQLSPSQWTGSSSDVSPGPITPSSNSASSQVAVNKDNSVDDPLEELFPEIVLDPDYPALPFVDPNEDIPIWIPDPPPDPPALHCRSCHAVCATDAALRFHNEAVHSRRHHCLVSGCRWSWETAKDLRRHAKVHGWEKDFRCPDRTCEYFYKGFKRKDIFRRHMQRRHQGASFGESEN